MLIKSFAEFISEQDWLDKAIAEQALLLALENQSSLVTSLLQLSMGEHYKLATAIADFFVLPLIQPVDINLEKLALDILDIEAIRKYKVIPIAKHGDVLKLATADPTLVENFNAITFLTGLKLELFIMDYDELLQLLESLLGDTTDTQSKDEDIPVIQLLNQILEHAVNKNASDIHFEPYKNVFRIRFRIDGILHELFKPEPILQERLIARLKIMANLDIAEKRLPQDGRFNIEVNKKAYDCRVSSCPTLFGEKVVVRILNPQDGIIKITDLGLIGEQLKVVQAQIHKPQGLILVTGPTGSGKTMSLYAFLNELNTSIKNISTAEDPIEINLPGINQVAINPKIDLNFAMVLRAFLRQDPDIIMVGEIRDVETADIAIKAAQTGHLVLSTLHTNSAVESITRLLNMGVETFNVSSSLSMVVAQRLVRKLCPYCKHKLTDNSFKAVGCSKCNQGYKGRIAVFEIIAISEAMRQLIAEHVDVKTLVSQAVQDGVVSLREAALKLVANGSTSFAEINRVI